MTVIFCLSASQFPVSVICMVSEEEVCPVLLGPLLLGGALGGGGPEAGITAAPLQDIP